MQWPWLLLLIISFPPLVSLITSSVQGQQKGEEVYLPLPPPIRCNYSAGGGCTVESYQRIWLDRKPCRAARAVYPTTEAELLEAVAWASQTGSKIKVVSRGSHSLPKLVCPGGDDGLLVSTHHYNSLIRVNRSSLRVTAQAGVMLRQLLDAIAAHNLTLPHTPYWQGVSVGGMISTGAHGSGLWHAGSAPHDYVVGVRLIVPSSSPRDGYAEVVDLDDGHDDLNAARLSLGVLGVISTVTFQLEPMFKRSVSLHIKGDQNLEDEILEFARAHEFGILNWYPGTGKVLFRVDDRVSVATEGDGAYKLAIVDKMEVQHIESLRNSMEVFEETQNVDDLCDLEDTMIHFRHSSGDGLVNDGSAFKGYPVVGFNHNMQTAGGCERDDSSTVIANGIEFGHVGHPSQGCAATIDTGMDSLSSKTMFTCFWNPLVNKSVFFFDVAISVPTQKAKDVIVEIKKLRDLNPKAMCALGQLGGFWIRFQAKSKAYLGEPNDSLVFEFVNYRAREAHTPRLHEDLFEEIEQMLLKQFNGKPHWGKNRVLAFEGMHHRTVAMDKFMEVKKRLDPFNLFSNEWTDAILGHESPHNVQSLHDFCALEGLCVCKEDSHCHPTKGYVCRPGRVFQEANVCRFEKQESLF